MSGDGRPTRDQVDDALAHVDSIRPVRTVRAETLAAEVRALRADLEVEVRCSNNWQRIADQRRDALAAHTPQPAEPDWVDEGVEHWETAGFWIERDATGRDGPTWRLNGDVVSRWVVQRFRDALTAALTEEVGHPRAVTAAVDMDNAAPRRFLRMSADLTVPCDDHVVVTYTGSLAHRCPFVDETDRGTVKIKWTTAGATFELHALTAWLGSFEQEQVSHEGLTDAIRAELSNWDGVDKVTVETSWKTAGAEVVVRALPGQPLHPGGA